MCQYVKAFYLLEEICRFVRFAMNGWARKGCFRYRKIDVLGGFQVFGRLSGFFVYIICCFLPCFLVVLW